MCRLLLVLVLYGCASPAGAPNPVPTQAGEPVPHPNQCIDMIRRGEKC